MSSLSPPGWWYFVLCSADLRWQLAPYLYNKDRAIVNIFFVSKDISLDQQVGITYYIISDSINGISRPGTIRPDSLLAVDAPYMAVIQRKEVQGTQGAVP